MKSRVAVGLLLFAVSAAAQTTATASNTTNLPPVGLASTETVQVNVLNTSPAPAPGTGTSCGGSISFYDSAGTMIGTATTFTVTPGQIFPAKLASTGSARAVVRARITTQILASTIISTLGFLPAVPIFPVCTLTYSLETYDSTTGVTHVFVSGPVTQNILDAVGLR